MLYNKRSCHQFPTSSRYDVFLLLFYTYFKLPPSNSVLHHYDHVPIKSNYKCHCTIFGQILYVHRSSLIGTGCTVTHIVPVAIYDSPALRTTFDDFNVRPWLTLDTDYNDWVEGQDYDVYSHFTSDDNVPIGVRYIILHEPQDTTASPANEYIHALMDNNIDAMPWLGNLLIFKTDWGMEVTNIEDEDLPLIKRLATLHVLKGRTP
ncbi:uncharacterized protein LACBIDRAFT_332371 [Laccaria bicolor S238N-H82]|uniref:Predicted protein n=1 Tax=Laccaria bicolor (strain S238N-H82 / ATCC MYA-4686) TaxID=486041 RepID=B0DSI6_LACBS|nr:uncharacterized protein LACBIDRAFT_332371 [Laccaria bicolor S238N-H82]EDR02555.1 predicted protein [Laccaria bicolor S238N-H82]|eukprot:XP_001886918.1 predicted protein [Laccaria bicolor S238N-H82]